MPLEDTMTRTAPQTKTPARMGRPPRAPGGSPHIVTTGLTDDEFHAFQAWIRERHLTTAAAVRAFILNGIAQCEKSAHLLTPPLGE